MNNVVWAVFDNREEARRAVTELRSAGIPLQAISLVGRPDDEVEIHDDEDGASKVSIVGAVAGGGVAGGLLGVAALAIPGVGPLVAAGAIAASAAPTAAAIGAAAGATGGAIFRMLSDHEVEGREAEYYEEQIGRGGIFVSVDTRLSEGRAESAQIILERCGGHSASNPRVTAS
jgi:Heat induced stress protein YflT domain